MTAEGEPAVEENAPPSDQVEFADPARLAALGDLYSKFLTSDEVLRRVPERPPAAQVDGQPVRVQPGRPAAAGHPAHDHGARPPSCAQPLNLQHLQGAARLPRRARQTANDIPQAKRVELELLVAPEVDAGRRARKPTASVLAFLLVLLGTVAVTHLLEALRNRRDTQELAIVDWDAGDDGSPGRRRGRRRRAGRAPTARATGAAGAGERAGGRGLPLRPPAPRRRAAGGARALGRSSALATSPPSAAVARGVQPVMVLAAFVLPLVAGRLPAHAARLADAAGR